MNLYQLLINNRALKVLSREELKRLCELNLIPVEERTKDQNSELWKYLSALTKANIRIIH